MTGQVSPTDNERLAPRVDVATAAVFLALGLAILVTALEFPTYREQKGEIYTAPGLVPGFYAVVLAALSVALGWRAVRRARRGLGATVKFGKEGSAALAIVGLLGVAYCTVLIGHLPFWLASALFVAAFIVVFEWPALRDPRGRARSLAVAIAIGLCTGVAVTLMFEKMFYVRLP